MSVRQNFSSKMPSNKISVSLNAWKPKCPPIKYLSAKCVTQNVSLTNVSHKKPFGENVCKLKCHKNHLAQMLFAQNARQPKCLLAKPPAGQISVIQMAAIMSFGQILFDLKTRNQLFWKQMNPSRCLFFLQRETNSKKFLSFPKKGWRKKRKCCLIKSFEI